MNPFDAPFIDRHALNKQRAIILELGDDIIRDKDQAFLLMAQQAMANGQPEQPPMEQAPMEQAPMEQSTEEPMPAQGSLQ
jgi:hypothetical protein